jgi:hypothetical protein
MQKIWMIINILSYTYALTGMYYVLLAWVHQTRLEGFIPDIDILHSPFGFYSMLIGLPLGAIISFLQKRVKSKLIGGIFLFFFIIGLILLDRALV